MQDRARSDSKLTFSQVQELLACYAANPCYAAVAEQFGVTGQPECVGGYFQHRITGLLRAQVERAAAGRAATGAAAAHAVRSDVRVPQIQTHFGRCYAQAFGHSVGQRGFVALPRGTQAHCSVDPTGRLDAHPGRLVTGARYAGRLVKLGAIGGGLDHVAQADAQPAALRTR